MDVDKPGNSKSPLNRVHLEAELERLRRREALLDATEQVANIGHCEWDYENHCIKSCSDGYARIYNMSVSEICALHSDWEKVLEQVHPDDRETYARSYHSLQEAESHHIEYRIKAEIRETDTVGVEVSACIGISVYPEDGTTAEALIRSADKAMYQVKHQGKNNFGFISVQNSA